MNHVRRSVLEQKAKQIEKLKGLKWTKALDEAAKEYGFSNFRHYLNVSEELRPSPQSKAASDFSSFSEFLLHLKSLKPLEARETCSKLGLSDHVKNYLLGLSQKGHLNPGGYFPNGAQKLEFDFHDFNFEATDSNIKITGGFLIQIKTLGHENYQPKSAVKSSDRFDGKFQVLMDSNRVLSLDSVEINDDAFWKNQ